MNEPQTVEGEVVSIGTALAVKTQNATELYRHATDVAGACGEIVKRTAQTIQGRKYVKVEGWQAIATTYGCVASSRDVEKIAGGFRSIGEVRRMSDGVVIATAEGFVGDDEPTWASRPEYAKRAMAQTRSISRACRSAFAFVVVLIDSELSTTPAEEVPDGGFNSSSKPIPAPAGVDKLRQQLAKPEAKVDPDAGRYDGMDDVTDERGNPARKHPPVVFRFGKSKDKSSFEVSDKDLDWYIARATESVADPSKERFKQQNAAELENLRAEQAFRG